MAFYPALVFSMLNGFLLIIPMLGLRFGLPAIIRKESLAELAFFPPVRGLEKLALKTYFITNTFLIFSPIMAAIQLNTSFAIFGLAIYSFGIIVMTFSLVNFSRTAKIKRSGIYRFSRNPMCIGYFLVYIGMALLIASWLHLFLTVIYQIAVHGLILSEERWCLEKFGEEYQDYLENVPRYYLI